MYFMVNQILHADINSNLSLQTTLKDVLNVDPNHTSRTLFMYMYVMFNLIKNYIMLNQITLSHNLNTFSIKKRNTQ
jgi:hypothetical protein